MEDIGVISIGTYEGMLAVYKVIRVLEDQDDMKAGQIFSKVLFRKTPHDGAVRSLKSSGKILASGGYDGTVALYDYVNLKNIGTLNQHEDSIDGIDFYQNSYMVTCSADKTICLWRTNDWSLIKQFKGHTGPVSSVAIAKCGKLMLSVGRDGAIRMWDLMRAHNAKTKKLATSSVTGKTVAVVPTIISFTNSDEKFLIVINRDIIVINGPTEEMGLSLSLPSQVMCVSVDGDDLWVGCASGSIYGWNLETEEKYGEYKITDRRIKYLKVQGGYITVLTSEGEVFFGSVNENHDIDTILNWNIDSRITCGDFHLFTK